MGAACIVGCGRKWRIYESGVAMTRAHHYLIAALLTCAAAGAQTVVALDGFHNNESKMPDHYQWDGTRPGGFSELGKLLQGLGAELRTVRERITPGVLAGVKVFIIVDPDTPEETDDPQY